MNFPRAAFACGLLFGVTACGAAASDTGTIGVTGNVCKTHADCGDGRCVSGVCAARSNAINYVMVEISPPVGVGSGEYGNVRYLSARTIGSNKVLDFSLDVVAEFSVAVAPPDPGCTAFGLDSEGYVPITLRAYVDSGIHGIATTNIEASSAATSGADVATNAVTVALAPGPTDLYIAPLSEGGAVDGSSDPGGRCDLAPILALGQVIEPGVVSLRQQMLPAKQVNIDVSVPAGVDGQSPLDGWTLDMVEPLGGRRLSSRRLLSNATRGVDGNLHHQVRLAYHSVIGLDAERLDGAELFRLTPPAVTLAPTYYVARSAMDLFDASSVVLSQIVSLPAPVVVRGLIESEVDGMPLRADIVATLEPGDAALTSALAHYQVATSTDAQGQFELQLLAGKYRVTAIPSAAAPYASRVAEWTVAATPAVQAGKLIRVGPMSTLTGIAYSALRREPLAGVTLSASPSSLGKRPTFLDELLGYGGVVGVRSQIVVADERGAFEIPLDEGTFDVALRPAEATGAPWGVRARVGVGSRATETLTIELPNPVAYSGSVSVPGPDAGSASRGLPGALLRFYALFDESGQLADSTVPAVSGVEIGHVRADDSGTYRVHLPEGLD